MRARTTTLVTALCVAALIAGASSGGSAKLTTATFVGDSVAASIFYVPAAQAHLKQGMRVQLDLKVCRRLTTRSCSFQGVTPPTALQAVRSYGRSLGDALIVDVGYNEGPSGYRTGLDRVMRAALAQGAHGVVWVTLRETRGIYAETNAVIRAAAKRWPQLIVADWNAFSYGKPWFRSDDGLHLTSEGAYALASFLRPYVVKAARIRPAKR
jgi:hypothetical protein